MKKCNRCKREVKKRYKGKYWGKCVYAMDFTTGEFKKHLGYDEDYYHYGCYKKTFPNEFKDKR